MLSVSYWLNLLPPKFPGKVRAVRANAIGAYANVAINLANYYR